MILGLVLGACYGGSGESMNGTNGGPVEVPPWACVPGETQPCACPDGLDGLLTCSADGSAFGECDCSPGAMSQGPLPTGTDSGTGTASDSGSDSDSGSRATGTTTSDGTTSAGPGSTTDPDPTTGGGGSSGGGGTSSTG